jgi:NAD(P)H-flavin reductase
MSFAIISEREPAGGGLDRVRLVVGPDRADTHTRHGQYVELRHQGPAPSTSSATTIAAAVRGYFAIASAPGQRTWELLVRDDGSMSERLRNLPLGSQVVVSDATGAGFPVESAHERPLVLAVTGSGISAVRSTLGARIEQGDARRTYLLYGIRDRSDLALASELEAVRAAGVEVAVCLSREQVDQPGFHRGHVQDVARTRGWKLTGGLVFAAGNGAMIAGMRDAAPALGLSPDDVRLNH